MNPGHCFSFYKNNRNSSQMCFLEMFKPPLTADIFQLVKWKWWKIINHVFLENVFAPLSVFFFSNKSDRSSSTICFFNLLSPQAGAFFSLLIKMLKIIKSMFLQTPGSFFMHFDKNNWNNQKCAFLNLLSPRAGIVFWLI